MQAQDPLLRQTIAAAFRVANRLGPGFLEEVCGNALVHERRAAGLHAVRQRGMAGPCDGVVAGTFALDLPEKRKALVALHARRNLEDAHAAQRGSCLAAMRKDVSLLINSSRPKIEIRRLMMDQQSRDVVVGSRALFSAGDGQR